MSEYEFLESLQRLEQATAQLVPVFDRMTALARSLEIAAEHMATASLSFEASLKLALSHGLDLTKPSPNGKH